MSADLIVMAFSGENGAENAQNALKTMRAGLISGLDYAVQIRRDIDGKIIFYRLALKAGDEKDLEYQLANVFAKALFGESSKTNVKQLVAAGMDEEFLKEVVDLLKPDSSALLVFIPQDSDVDKRRLLKMLTLIEGRIFHTSFPAAIETAIMEEVKIFQED